MAADSVAGGVPDEIRERVARAFHEAYERLAPDYGYETRKASAVPWADVPENNKALMIATSGEALAVIARDRDALIAMLGACPTDATESVALPRDTSNGVQT